MADVSHELGALRFVVESPLSSKVAMFNNQAQQHKHSQSLNPFSQNGSRASSPKPTFSKDEYGKPLAGSLTEMRGQKANMHVLKEMLELCQIIASEGYDCKDEPTMRVIPFGELFNIYNYISDKVVGILLRARKHKLVDFEGEMLYQRRDDNVPIFLLKPILEIRRELESKIDDIKRGTSPAPLATSVLLDKNAQNRTDLSVPNSNRNSKSRSTSPKAVKKEIIPTKIEIEAAVDTLAKLNQNELKNDAKPTEGSIKNGEIIAAATPTIVNGNVNTTTNIEKEIIVNENAAKQEMNGNVAAVAGETKPNLVIATEVAAVVETAVTTAVTANKIDENNNNKAETTTAAATNTTMNTTDEIPTIIIEASAVYERRPSAPAESGESKQLTAETTTATAAITETTTPPSSS